MSLKKIKFITGNYSEELNSYLMGLTPSSKGIFGNYKFYFNSEIEDYDYLVVFEHLSEKIKVSIPKLNCIFIVGEATSIKKYNQNFLDQFGHIITCQEGIKHKSKFLKSPGHTWFSKKTYDELENIKNIKKEKLLSIVVSNKTLTQGHKDRLEFCLKLKKELGNKVDLFGRGFNDFDDKWDVIAPYKYSIAVENSVEDHWITEKLGDCYTSHTFPFYMGAPNVSEYYDMNSYEIIDIYNFDESLRKIENILNDTKHYDQHLKYLIKAKFDYMNKYSMIPMICDVIDNNIKNKIRITKKNNFYIYPEKINNYKKLVNFVLLKIRSLF